MEIENENLDIGNEAENQQNDFSIPEEYQDKGWAKFFDGKSGDELKSELFKAYDSSQSLIGKKVGDYISTTDLTQLENWEEIKGKLTEVIAPKFKTPEEISEYKLEEMLLDEQGNEKFFAPQEAIDKFSQKFKDIGINVEQAQDLFRTYVEFEMEQFQKYTDADELEKNVSEMFKSNPARRKECEGLIKEFLSQEDRNFIQDTMPNNVIEMFYKVSKGLVDKYGYKEQVARDNPITLTRSADEKTQRYNELCNKLEELKSRTHTTSEKDAILKELQEVFK